MRSQLTHANDNVIDQNKDAKDYKEQASNLAVNLKEETDKRTQLEKDYLVEKVQREFHEKTIQEQLEKLTALDTRVRELEERSARLSESESSLKGIVASKETKIE